MELKEKEKQVERSGKKLEELQQSGVIKRMLNKKKISAANQIYSRHIQELHDIEQRLYLEQKEKNKPLIEAFLREQVRSFLKKNKNKYVRLAIDSSGSFNQESANILADEFKSCCPKGEVVLFTHEMYFRETAEHLALPLTGVTQGGTDFRCLFEQTGDQKIESMIVYTDGYGIAPLRSDIKTLWMLGGDYSQIPDAYDSENKYVKTEVGEALFISHHVEEN